MLGVFDSGIGGLSVANAILQKLPKETLLYFGDTARLPYGRKAQSTIRSYCFQITDFLVQQGCKAIIIACNTASAAALCELRDHWPSISFIGMEPAVKPGAKHTRSGKIGVLATAGTFSSYRYEKLTNTFARDIQVWEDPCVGLVELIEEGKVNTPEMENLLSSILQPMLAEQVDTFILGCTHYPFAQAVIQKIIGPDKTIINPAPAVANQVKRVLEQQHLLCGHKIENAHQFFSSGDTFLFEENLKRYFQAPYEIAQFILN